MNCLLDLISHKYTQIFKKWYTLVSIKSLNFLISKLIILLTNYLHTKFMTFFIFTFAWLEFKKNKDH